MINIIVIFLILLTYFLFNRYSKAGENFTNNKVLTFPKPQNWNELSFTDKLKIYGSNLTKEHSFYADKLRVKNYINSLNIDGLYTTKTIAVLDKNNPNLYLSSLPKNCVIKSNNSSGPIIIVKNRKIKIIKPDNIGYKQWLKIAVEPHITKHEKHYIDIKPEIFVEQHLGDNVSDYKFFCFHGKVKFFSIDSDRFINGCRNFYDKNFNLLKFTKGDNNCSKKLKKPKNLEKMINIAEKLSKIFEFTRVDLYEINDKIYFGELTFLPAGGRNDIKPEKYNKLIGSYWK